MSEKQRLSVSIDNDLVDAARAAVEQGEAHSVSAWVGAAMRDRAERDRKLRLMGEWISEFEAEHGEITEAEMDASERAMRARSIVVRAGRVYRPSA
ncbi:hypothetical protein ACVGOW_17445 [Pseudonocardia saturnea]